MLHSFVMARGRVEYKCGLTDTSEIKKIHSYWSILDRKNG